MNFRQKICMVALGLLALGNFQGDVAAQSVTQGQTDKQKWAQPAFSLVVSTESLLIVSLKAEKAPLASIAAELSKKLQVPVQLGFSVAKQDITTDFKRLALEPALHLLAPAVYIDYEISSAPGQQQRAVGIYLGGYADPPPAINSVVANNALVYAFEGDTEEGTEEAAAKKVKEKDEPLQVSYEAYALTVKAKKQPLAVVLYRIAREIGIPLDLKDNATELIDLDINKLPLEDAVSRLAPNVRLYVRADLQRTTRTPFRLALTARENDPRDR